MKLAPLALGLVVVLLAGVAGYYWNLSQQPQQEAAAEPPEAGEPLETVTTANATVQEDTGTTTTAITQAGHQQQGPHGKGQGRQGHGDHGGQAEGVCKNIGDMEPRDAVQWLLDNHGVFNYTYVEYPENMTIEWVITGPSDAVEILYYHILQMRCAIENGGTPRRHDPVFQLDAKIGSQYIETMVELVNDTTLRVVKKAENECAYEVMKLHAEVIQQFFEQGRPAASVPHEVPQEVLELCKPYLVNQMVTG